MKNNDFEAELTGGNIRCTTGHLTDESKVKRIKSNGRLYFYAEKKTNYILQVVLNWKTCAIQTVQGNN